jgi:transcriptional regulator with XRE-family HTH domain
MILHSKQIELARTALKMTRADLSVETGVSISTIQRFEENNDELQNARQSTVNNIKNYFTKIRGIKFLFAKEEDEELDGIGIRYYNSKDKGLFNKDPKNTPK